MNAALRSWYAPRRRVYPWRGARDPYRVLVSEVMLQQTQVSRVVPAYRAFLRRFPTIGALARAPRSEVVRAWGGLGYNRRAVALSEAAGAIVREHRGRVPADVETLATLPGIGPYTAAAVASLAYGVAVPAIDTNIRRVVARARLGDDGAPDDAVREAARRWIDPRDPAGWNQAVMDLGREHCRSTPFCEGCPLARGCRFRRVGGKPSPRPASGEAFEGSSRQLRGAIVRRVREGAVTLETLQRLTGSPAEGLAHAVRGLRRDGIVSAGPRALAGLPSGRASLA